MAIKSITRVSTSATVESLIFGNSFYPVFSPDGGKVAFTSFAFNLVPGDNNSTFDVFVKDLATGAIQRVSTDAAGLEANGYSHERPVFSPDGSKLAFSSSASNLVSGDTNELIDIFVKDVATDAIERVSTNAAGMEGNDYSSQPAFSPDGSKLAFSSSSTNLVPGDTNGASDIFIKDVFTGAIERISTDATGSPSNGSSYSPSFSPHGNRIAFDSYAFNLVPDDTNGAGDVFIKDLATGAIERISTDATGVEGDGDSSQPVFSPDGSKLAFSSSASNLVPGDTNGAADIFVKDLTTGAIQRVSTDAAGVEATGGSTYDGNTYFYGSYSPAFSPDGRKILFWSYASNLVSGDTNEAPDTFIKDLATGAIARLSTDIEGREGNGGSSNPVFSTDGSKVAFDSGASNLVPGDSDGYYGYADIFVVELDDQWLSPARWLIAPQSLWVNESDGAATFTISRPDWATSETVYVSVVENQGTANQGDYAIKLNEPLTFALDEREKPVEIDILNDEIAEDDETFRLIVQQAPDQPVSTFLASTTFTIEDDDRPLPIKSVIRVSTSADGEEANSVSSGLVFSPDNSKVAFDSQASNLIPGDTNGASDIFIKDLGTGTIARVSTDADGREANGYSYGAVFSPDGRKVAFTSDATNLVPGDTNGRNDIFIKDLATGAPSSASLPTPPGRRAMTGAEVQCSLRTAARWRSKAAPLTSFPATPTAVPTSSSRTSRPGQSSAFPPMLSKPRVMPGAQWPRSLRTDARWRFQAMLPTSFRVTPTAGATSSSKILPPATSSASQPMCPGEKATA